ncbi:hypothetical protein HDU81_005223 [Chytriomyces hyalinus]|nr:hypothetical protein HDU81_005223 [Chytriomyces hyalinus]
MDKLPIEVLHAILICTDIDGGLIQLALTCRRFAAILNGDITFALAHYRKHFQLPRDGLERYLDLSNGMNSGTLDAHNETLWHHLNAQVNDLTAGSRGDTDMLAVLLRPLRSNSLAVQTEQRDDLPFAYQAALFVMASQIDKFGMAKYPPDRTLRIVQSLDSDHKINWVNAFKYFGRKNHIFTIDYVISNRLFGASNTPILAALADASFMGRTELVSWLITCQTGVEEPLSLDDALLSATEGKQLQCVQALLNDPLGRVTLQGRDNALEQSVRNENLPISALLIQHGVSPNVLNYALDKVCGRQEEEETTGLGDGKLENYTERLFLEPGVDPSYQDNALLVESMRNYSCNLTRLLLNDARVSLASNDYRAVRMALDLSKVDTVKLFLEFAEKADDLEPLRIVHKYLEQTVPTDFTHALGYVIFQIAATAV